MNDDNLRARLIEAVKTYAVEHASDGESYVLKGGARSQYYVDCRNLCLTANGLGLVVNALWKEIIRNNNKFTAFGGPAIGADPIVGGLLMMTSLTSLRHHRHGFLIRPESKHHGKKGRVAGPLKEGDLCILVEDVVNTGSSLLDVADIVEAYGAEVVHAYCIVDRLQGAAEAIATRGIPFTPLLTVHDLGIDLPQQGTD